MNDRILFSVLPKLSESRLQVTVLAALADKGSEGFNHFNAIGDDEAWRQNESVVAVGSVSAHLVSVADWDVVLSDCVVNAGSRGGVCGEYRISD